jgi:predicted deacylase
MISSENISCDLDFDSDGKRLGNLNLKFSDNRHAFDKIPIPVAVIKNGSGPTLLLTAGNHGDEYEGQVILRRLIHQLEPEQINGRIIMLPALNYPAVLGNSRVSPLDQGNLNREFPGNEHGLPTSAIAHFVSSYLLPMADAGIDLHSGGSQTYYLPSVFLCSCKDPEIMDKSLAMAEAFNAPFAFMVRGEGSATGLDPIAHNQTVPFISTELSGGANVDIVATEIGMQGVKNVFQFLGLQGAGPSSESTTRFLNGIDGMHHVSAPFSGIFEPYHELGTAVVKGDIAGMLYSTEEVERSPQPLFFENDGIVMVRRNGARVRRGSHVFMVAEEVDRKYLLNII